MSYDVIGDVHGQHGKLVALLRHMGYSETSGAWRCPGRTAIFVGDLIDRGPKQLDTVELVQRMVAAGSARCIMGNHEFNAIAWATRDPKNRSRYLRRHGKRGNRRHHRAFLREVEGTPRHDEIIAWFRTLPLWLDLGGIRVVHACWDEASMDVLRPLLTLAHTLTDQALELGSRRGDPVFDAIEVVCKGPEIRLPEGVSFPDKEGKERREVRVKWWEENHSTYRDAAMVSSAEKVSLPAVPLPPDWTPYRYTGSPVLFGHYWFSGKPAVISGQFACLDYSAARDGPLVAYRWDGEAALSSDKLAWV